MPSAQPCKGGISQLGVLTPRKWADAPRKWLDIPRKWADAPRKWADAPGKWTNPTSTKIIFFLLLAGGEALLAFQILRSQTALLFTVFAVCFAAYAFICKARLTTGQISLLILGGFLLRLMWLWAPPQLSDDYARFLWDGRLAAAGFNPFLYLPADLMKDGLPASAVADPRLFAAMNSPEYFTLYPPILQALFAGAAKLAPHNIYWGVVLLKVPILLAEGSTLLLLPKLLKAWKMPPNRVLLYALNPLVIAELVGNVHHEGIVIFFLVLMLWLLQKGSLAGGAIALAAAAATKMTPLLFMPLLFFHFGWKKGSLLCGGALVLFALSWLPFLSREMVAHVTESIGLYFNLFEFNGSIYYGVRDIVFAITGEIEIEIIAPVLAAISTTLILIYAFVTRWRNGTEMHIEKLPLKMIITLTIYLLFTTMVHPWYTLPLLAFCIFTPLRYPVLWSLLIVSSYWEYHVVPEVESGIQLWLEYGVLLVFMGLEWQAYRRQKSGIVSETHVSPV